jgi:hypothetical protein
MPYSYWLAVRPWGGENERSGSPRRILQHSFSVNVSSLIWPTCNSFQPNCCSSHHLWEWPVTWFSCQCRCSFEFLQSRISTCDFLNLSKCNKHFVILSNLILMINKLNCLYSEVSHVLGQRWSPGLGRDVVLFGQDYRTPRWTVTDECRETVEWWSYRTIYTSPFKIQSYGSSSQRKAGLGPRTANRSLVLRSQGVRRRADGCMALRWW